MTFNNKPLVSIVIPTYNREKYISQAIESSINQTYKNIEIIIIDNQSTDNTWSIIQEYSLKDSRIACYQNDINLGPVLNWNEGFKKASGTYMKILWSDDWMSLDFIEKSICYFTNEIAFVISGQQILNQTEIISEISYRKSKYTRNFFLTDILLFNNERFPISPGCAIFRTKDVLDSFVINISNDDSLDSQKNGAGNDLLLFLQISVNYTHIASMPGVDSYFRHHQGSFSVDNNLYLYYEWAKVYFVNNNKVSSFLSNSLKALFLLRKFKNRCVYKNIYRHLSFKQYFPLDILVFYFRLFVAKTLR